MTCSNKIPTKKFTECKPFNPPRFDLNDFLKTNRVLVLSLKKAPFEIMVTGEKDFECRKPSKWIMSRVYDYKKDCAKNYDYVLFINGYGSHRPYFIAKYEGYGTNYNNSYTFSNGFTLQTNIEDVMIFLGEVIMSGNIIAPSNQKKLL